MSSGIEEHDRIAYFGEVPWHGIGTQAARPMTTSEALTLAEKNWTVSLRPVYFHEREAAIHKSDCALHNGPALPPGPCDCGASNIPFVLDADHFVVVRDDIMLPLGIVGNRYTPVQNTDAFSFLDGLIGEAEAMVHTTGSLYNGKKIWVLVQLPGYIKVKDDDVGKFLLLANAHDGSMSLTLKMTPIRVVCANTLASSMHSHGSTWNLRHTLSLPTKIEAARAAIGLASQRFEKTGELYQFLGDHDMTVTEMDAYLKAMFPDTDDNNGPIDGAEAIRGKVLALFEGQGKGLDTPNIRRTAWAAYNALTEYLNWQVGRKTDARMQSIWFGSLQQKINSSLVELMRVIGAPVPGNAHVIPEEDLEPGLVLPPAGAEDGDEAWMKAQVTGSTETTLVESKFPLQIITGDTAAALQEGLKDDNKPEDPDGEGKDS